MTDQQIKEQVVEKFGAEHALGGVVSIEQLGLHDTPLNASGKVQKLDLIKALSSYRAVPDG